MIGVRKNEVIALSVVGRKGSGLILSISKRETEQPAASARYSKNISLSEASEGQ